jgi:hypothetical protein
MCLNDGFDLRAIKQQIAGAGSIVSSPPANHTGWETCQLGWSSTGSFLGTPAGRFYFVADAVSPVVGRYVADRSDEFQPRGIPKWILWAANAEYKEPLQSDRHAATALTGLINKLVEAGWQHQVTRGRYWWEHRFRRPAETEFQTNETIDLYEDEACQVPAGQLGAGSPIVVLGASDSALKIRTPDGTVRFTAPPSGA